MNRHHEPHEFPARTNSSSEKSKANRTCVTLTHVKVAPHAFHDSQRNTTKDAVRIARLDVDVE